ncbi:SMI1/KNR4 family protein [Bacillus sp. S4]|uniref:Knr4/Smi1-like domain-containing protein n=1 Tax=Bacillus cereus VD118 TaxID=1053231 RepID=R8QEK5_BACCE|nr:MULTISPECIES: SMI1/KNR4 family protein [Bacillus]EOP68828.1 hypothetical protein IIQ_02081 [Bacillus cereus VD118]MBJ8094520.1 SMI1/KNR4 family protein [Bacillus cereus]MBM6647986.1 SMI1/KNR4 family protein [Bacillus sp. RIT 809]MCQ6359096.1 SMI1/KNR4 family protein [Bacillus cereus]OOQ92592.1 SMI1/KNR4 family protein [Bacillus cereus]
MGVKKWLFSGGSLAEDKIVEVESLFGFSLPDDYKKCVMENDGGYPEPNTFDCDSGRIEAVFNDLISLTDEDLNIKMFSEFAIQKLIPFGRDPFGNLICFDYRQNKNEPTVIFYNHEEQNESAIEPICNTFTELLNRLYY